MTGMKGGLEESDRNNIMILGVYSGRKNKMVCDSLTGQSQWIFLVSGRKWGIVDKLY
jgi:hypothetical protein